MSTDSSKKSLAGVTSKGYLPFLKKPLDMDIVLVKVREALGNGREFGEHRQSMRVIEEIQERFRTMIEASNDLFFQCNTDGIITYCSPASNRFLGYSPEELIGTHFKEYFPKSDIPVVLDLFRKSISGEEMELQELHLLNKDKTLLPIEVNSVPVIRDGTIVGSQGIVRDVSERKRTEEAIRQRERILEAISYAAEKLLTGPWKEDIVDILGHLGEAAEVSRVCLFENHKTERGQLLTSQRYEWTATGVDAQIDNPALQSFPLKKGGLGRWIEIMEDGEIVQGKVRDFPKREREVLSAQNVVSIIAVPVFVAGSWWGFICFDESSRVRDWSKTVVDALRIAATTIGAAIQREKTERMMSDQTFMIEEVFHNVQDGIGIVDENETVIFCNPAYARILNEEIEDIIGKNLSEFMDKESYSVILDQTRTRRKGDASMYDIRMTTNFGKQKHIRVAASPRFTEEGSYIGAFGSIRDITDLKQVAEDLEKSEKRYRGLVESSLVGIFQTNLKGEILFVNDVLWKMMECRSAEEMMTAGVLRFYKDQKDRDIFLDSLRKENKVEKMTLEAKTFKGNTKFFELSAVFYGDLITGTMNDITERKRVREDLEEAKEHLRHVLDSNPSVIYSCAIESKGKGKKRYIPTFVSDNIAKIFGFEVEECLGDHTWWNRHIHPEDREEAVKEMNRLFTDGQIVHEYRIRGKDGDYIWIRDELILIEDLKGKSMEFIGSWSNITDRKEAEISLLESEAQWRSVTENSPDHIMLVDTDGIIRFLNHASPGLKREDYVGTSLFSHFSREDENEVRKIFKSVMDTGEPIIFTNEYKPRDGHIIHYETLYSARKVNGKTIGLTLTSRDITERKEAENAIIRRDEILEAVSFAAGRFIQVTSWEEAIQNVLEQLGKAANVCRTYLFQTHRGEKGNVLTSQRYEWTRKGVKSQIDNPYLQNFDFQAAGWGRWMKTLRKGESINGHVKDFPKVEQKELTAEEVKSICVMPIFVRGDWWGSIGFSVCESEREWTPAELEALRAAANILGAAIQRSQSEDELRESEQRFRSVFDNATVGVNVVDVNTHEIFLSNDRFLQMLGYTTDEIAGMTVEEIYPEEELEWIMEEFSRISAGKITQSSNIPVKRKDGSIFYADISGSYMMIDGRKLLAGYFQDVSDRKESEEALRASEAKYRSLVNNALVGIVQSTVDGKMLFVNDAMVIMAGFNSKEDMMAQGAIPRYRDPKMRKEWIQALQKNGRVDNFEIEMIKKDGSIGYGLLSAVMHGGIITSVSIDITERVKIEEQLRKSQEELRNLSSHLQLVREEERSKISREIHDELGQSLSALKMNLSWVSSKIPEKEKALRKKVKELEKLIEGNILLVQRISTELRPRLLDDLGLAAAIEWHLDNFQHQSGIRCKFTCEPKEPKLGNEVSVPIYRIFQEALTNIYRHAKATSASVRLRIDSEKIVMTIKDNGMGITRDKVTDPVSLGIIGMKERAIAMGGKVTIRGTKSKGTTVTLQIPLHKKGKSS
jgi:PAS domain S-box-containing protein